MAVARRRVFFCFLFLKTKKQEQVVEQVRKESCASVADANGTERAERGESEPHVGALVRVDFRHALRARERESESERVYTRDIARACN